MYFYWFTFTHKSVFGVYFISRGGLYDFENGGKVRVTYVLNHFCALYKIQVRGPPKDRVHPCFPIIKIRKSQNPADMIIFDTT